MNRSRTLEALIISANRLTRIAAAATGNSTPVAQWRTLSILQSEGPMRIGELASASRVSQPGMTRLLATMIEEELVSRVADNADSRAWLIQLTPKGLAASNAWHDELIGALSPLFDDLDADDWVAMERIAALLTERTSSKSKAKVLA